MSRDIVPPTWLFRAEYRNTRQAISTFGQQWSVLVGQLLSAYKFVAQTLPLRLSLFPKSQYCRDTFITNYNHALCPIY